MKESKIIGRINLFYLEIPRIILSQKDHEILNTTSIEKKSINLLEIEFNHSQTNIIKAYVQLVLKLKRLAEILNDTDEKKYTRIKLIKRHSVKKQIWKNKFFSKLSLSKQISDSHFSLILRLSNILNSFVLFTIKQLTDVPLKDYLKLRGFKTRCMNELITFIKYENLEFYFEDFHNFK